MKTYQSSLLIYIYIFLFFFSFPNLQFQSLPFVTGSAVWLVFSDIQTTIYFLFLLKLALDLD